MQHPKPGHKKPGLNMGSAGITSVPGLFSELFNVAASRPAQMTTEQAEISPRQAFRQGGPGPVASPEPPNADPSCKVSLCFQLPSYLISSVVCRSNLPDPAFKV
jgi:hypothetical protein